MRAEREICTRCAKLVQEFSKENEMRESQTKICEDINYTSSRLMEPISTKGEISFQECERNSSQRQDFTVEELHTTLERTFLHLSCLHQNSQLPHHALISKNNVHKISSPLEPLETCL